MKLILIAGIFLLAGGCVARLSGSVAAALLFSAGGTCKIIYIFLSIQNGSYRPGYEILYLVSGLILLASGNLLRRSPEYAPLAVYVIISAVLFKLAFVLRFIQKAVRHREESCIPD